MAKQSLIHTATMSFKSEESMMNFLNYERDRSPLKWCYEHIGLPGYAWKKVVGIRQVTFMFADEIQAVQFKLACEGV